MPHLLFSFFFRFCYPKSCFLIICHSFCFATFSYCYIVYDASCTGADSVDKKKNKQDKNQLLHVAMFSSYYFIITIIIILITCAPVAFMRLLFEHFFFFIIKKKITLNCTLAFYEQNYGLRFVGNIFY